MPSYKRPGVYAQETAQPSFVPQVTGSMVAAFFGPHWRGPTVPRFISSWSEFRALFGDFTTNPAKFSYLPYGVFSFFNNGGVQCYVTRVVGTGASKATKNLVDRAATPQNTLQVDAHNVGVWGASVYVDVVTRDAVAGRFDLVVKYGGATDGYRVETFLDLSMNSTDARYVVTIVNDLQWGSKFITVTDLASATASPSNMPAAQTGTQLVGGADGSAPSSGDKNTALQLLDTVPVPTVINFPGDSDATLHGNIITYAEARADCFAVLDMAAGLTPTTAISNAGSLAASSYAATYWPWLVSLDPSASASGAKRTLPPGPMVLGLYSRTERDRGIHKAPAGADAKLTGVVDTERQQTLTELENLNDGNVNAIRPFVGSGLSVMGARTLKKTGAERYVPVRRTLIAVRYSLVESTKFAVFEPNDENLWARIRLVSSQVLDAFWQRGSLRGGIPAEAYYVKCDAELNTRNVIDSGEVRFEVGVAVQIPAEFVVLTIGQWQSGPSIIEQ